MDLSIMIAALAFLLSAIQFFGGQKEATYNKRKSWYQTEMFNKDKIERYYNALKEIIKNDTDKFEKCKLIDEETTNFIFGAVDYIKFLNVGYCSKIKKLILVCSDELVAELLEDTFTEKDGIRLVDSHRFKLYQMFYEFDVVFGLDD